MDTLRYIVKFFLRIRYWLFFGSIIVTLLVFYATRSLSKTYSVNTTIFTGIVSGEAINNENSELSTINNEFDNIINLINAKNTLKEVSIKLFGLSMMYGDKKSDNTYISALNYQKLIATVPPEVQKLIDKSSFENTLNNLKAYQEGSVDNYIYGLLNGSDSHYSYKALENAKISRLGNSDMLKIEYQNDDPGIAYQTVKLLSEQLFKKYEDIRNKNTNDVISYFDNQLGIISTKLHSLEDSLTQYNVANNIINYPEQAKELATKSSDFDSYEQQLVQNYASAEATLKQLEKHMDGRSQLTLSNTEFIKALDQLSTLNGKISEIESFNLDKDSPKNAALLKNYKELSRNTEEKIHNLSNQINQIQDTKEGLASNDIASRWLEELINYVKFKAQLKVMESQRSQFNKQYGTFSPIGTNLKRREREISLTESSYLQFQNALNEARQKQKNIEMSTAALNIITPPEFPLYSDPGKRGVYILGAFAGSIIFIIGFFILMELLDKTIRDATRAKRLTGLSAFSAFPGKIDIQYRGFNKECSRFATTYLCSQLGDHLFKEKTSIINLLSLEKGEGKSHIAKFLKEYWQDFGLNVKYLSYETDFNEASKTYLQAKSLKDFISFEQDTDLIIVEYESLDKSFIPTSILKEAQVNLLITDACRVWKSSNEKMLKNLENQIPIEQIFMILNKVEREYIEEFTGQLPPYSRAKNIRFRLSQFGLTAEKV